MGGGGRGAASLGGAGKEALPFYIHKKWKLREVEKDRALIKAIPNYFGGIGYVSKPNKASTVEFRVSSLKDLVNVILPHFGKYPLITKKRTDYLLFKQIVSPPDPAVFLPHFFYTHKSLSTTSDKKNGGETQRGRGGGGYVE